MIANVKHLRIPQPDRPSPLSIRRIRKRETPLASMLPNVSHLLFTKQLHILIIDLNSSRDRNILAAEETPYGDVGSFVNDNDVRMKYVTPFTRLLHHQPCLWIGQG